MSKEDELKATKIPEIIPGEENILIEGILKIIKLHKRIPTTFLYKYAITDKGIWTRPPKGLFGTPKSVFTAYDYFEDVEVIVHLQQECCVFHHKKGTAVNGIYFDDLTGVMAVLEGRVKKKE